MVSISIDFILQNFELFSLGLILLGAFLTLTLIRFRTDVRYQFLASIIPIFTLLGLFWVRLSNEDAKIYSFFIPLAHLIIVLLSALLLFNSIRRYQRTFSKIEYRLIFFYFINFLVWFILFLQDIFTIGKNNVEDLQFLPFLGLLLLTLSIGAAITIYYIGKSIFYPNYRRERIFENLLYTILGIIIGITYADLDESIYINSEIFNQQTFVFPNLFKPYGVIIIIFLFVPYLIIAIRSRVARGLLEQSKKHGGSIDPVAIPRLKLTELSMYIYLIGAGGALGLTLLPGFVPGLIFPFGLNTLLSVPFIAIVDISLYLAFQTPDWLKNRWRIQDSQSKTTVAASNLTGVNR